jgi:phenolic acid decarboxylase
VSLIVNLGDRLFHGTIFFPRWVINNPEKTVCFQNDHIPLMESYRAAGPAYPTEVIDEFATITFVRDCGADNDSVIACAASELPADFLTTCANAGLAGQAVFRPAWAKHNGQLAPAGGGFHPYFTDAGERHREQHPHRTEQPAPNQ